MIYARGGFFFMEGYILSSVMSPGNWPAIGRESSIRGMGLLYWRFLFQNGSGWNQFTVVAQKYKILFEFILFGDLFFGFDLLKLKLVIKHVGSVMNHVYL